VVRVLAGEGGEDIVQKHVLTRRFLDGGVGVGVLLVLLGAVEHEVDDAGHDG